MSEKTMPALSEEYSKIRGLLNSARGRCMDEAPLEADELIEQAIARLDVEIQRLTAAVEKLRQMEAEKIERNKWIVNQGKLLAQTLARAEKAELELAEYRKRDANRNAEYNMMLEIAGIKP
jgi:vacuolar-type H+-ATPase subunit I/STV1